MVSRKNNNSNFNHQGTKSTKNVEQRILGKNIFYLFLGELGALALREPLGPEFIEGVVKPLFFLFKSFEAVIEA